MIEVTKIGKSEKKFTINPRLIEMIKMGPGNTSLIEMGINNKKISVLESRELLMKKIKEYEVSVIQEAINNSLINNSLIDRKG